MFCLLDGNVIKRFSLICSLLVLWKRLYLLGTTKVHEDDDLQVELPLVIVFALAFVFSLHYWRTDDMVYKFFCCWLSWLTWLVIAQLFMLAGGTYHFLCWLFYGISLFYIALALVETVGVFQWRKRGKRSFDEF